MQLRISSWKKTLIIIKMRGVYVEIVKVLILHDLIQIS